MGAPRARDHLTAIADRPRAAGSEAESAARSYCARVLRDAGFAVREDAFEYSAFPGRYATSVFGLASTLLLVVAMTVAARGDVARATATLIAGGITLAVGATWVARAGVLHARVARKRGVNLSATRGGQSPPVWLVAHLDTKSQPVPMLVRAGAIALHGVTWGAALLLCVVDLFGGIFAAAWSTVGAAAVATGLPIVASVVGDRSAGAVDDASGVAAVLIAAATLPRELPVGVLLTSAEELGLAGARAWVRERRPAVALNCDGLDDDGELLLMYSGAKPARLLDVFHRAARTDGDPARVRRLLPGILTDAVAFSDAGWEAITLSRGTIKTLSRIHTRRDNLELLTGAGVDAAAPLLARVARELS
jgi:putative aminopeptidase FrvX